MSSPQMIKMLGFLPAAMLLSCVLDDTGVGAMCHFLRRRFCGCAIAATIAPWSYARMF